MQLEIYMLGGTIYTRLLCDYCNQEITDADNGIVLHEWLGGELNERGAFVASSNSDVRKPKFYHKPCAESADPERKMWSDELSQYLVRLYATVHQSIGTVGEIQDKFELDCTRIVIMGGFAQEE